MKVNTLMNRILIDSLAFMAGVAVVALIALLVG